MIIVVGPLMWVMIGVGYVVAYTLWGTMALLAWLLRMLLIGLIVTGTWGVTVALPALMTYLRGVRQHR